MLPSLTRPRVPLLLVDGDDGNRRVLAALLRSTGLSVMAVATGRAALCEADWCPPSLVVSEFRLSDMAARDLMARLRQRGQAAPLLLVTADISPAARQAGQRVPAYLLKPYHIDAVLEAVARLLPPTAPPRGWPSPSLGRLTCLQRSAAAWKGADDE